MKNMFLSSVKNIQSQNQKKKFPYFLFATIRNAQVYRSRVADPGGVDPDPGPQPCLKVKKNLKVFFQHFKGFAQMHNEPKNINIYNLNCDLFLPEVPNFLNNLI